MSWFKIDVEDDDEETRKLDAKVEEVLKDIALMSSGAPEAISKWLEQSVRSAGAQPPEIDKILDSVKKAYDELPKLTGILSNWTATLSAYASYRMLKKQEKIARDNLRTAQILAGATVLLAMATFALVLVTVFR